MKIVIDMQGAQTDFSRHRGVGRYTLGLVKALLCHSKGHEIILALNGSFSDAIEPIRAEFEGLIPQKNICVWEQHYDCAAYDPSLAVNKKMGEITREIFLETLNGDIVFSTNLQEGLFDAAVTSVHVTSSTSCFCTTLHDVTPLLMPERYLANPINRTWYYEKLDGVRSSEIIITDSLYSKEQIVKSLEVSEKKVHVVYLAVDEQIFKPMRVSPLIKEQLFQKIGVTGQFFIYAGGSDEHKNLDRLYQAYSLVPKNIRHNCQLVMVGKELHREQELHLQKVKKWNIESDVIFTGYVSDEELALLYNCCSSFIFPSIQEGFGLPPLEAMACGAPVIGSDAASIPEVIGFKDALFDPFDCNDIALKIEKILTDSSFRDVLSQHGLQQAKKFSWENSASELIAIFETFVSGQKMKSSAAAMHDPLKACMDEFVKIKGFESIASRDLAKIAASLADTFPVDIRPKLLLDMSSLINLEDRSGIQRVALSIAKHLMAMKLDVQVVPVYTSIHDHEFYCANAIMEMMGDTGVGSKNRHIEFNNGDILVFLDLHPSVTISHTAKTKHLRNRGVLVYHVVYDLLPIQFPDYFWPELCTEFDEWLKAVSQSDGVLCISKTVASEFENWYTPTSMANKRKFVIDWFHLGADVKNGLPSFGLPPKSEKVISKLKHSVSFVMVGTVEPRKGHKQVLEAVESLWADGVEVNLVIVGRKGWKVDELMANIQNHAELNKRLFLLEGVSDEYLELIYANSSALIAASFGEGFGLPLIEAAQYKLPIIAREIPVFKEVAGTSAFYFQNSTDPLILAEALKNWIDAFRLNAHQRSDTMNYLTWEESAKQLLNRVLYYRENI